MTWGPAVFGTGSFVDGRGSVDVVDKPSAVEFMREALVKISEEDIGTVIELLAIKRNELAPFLTAEALAAGNAEVVRPILARMFAVRRRSDELLLAVLSGDAETCERLLGQLLQSLSVHDLATRPAGKNRKKMETERKRRGTN